jgi:rRNA maturation protein Nop10
MLSAGKTVFRYGLVIVPFCIMIVSGKQNAKAGSTVNHNNTSKSTGEWRKYQKSLYIDTINAHLGRLDIDSITPDMLRYPHRYPYYSSDELLAWMKEVVTVDLWSISLDTLRLWANRSRVPEALIGNRRLLGFCRNSKIPPLSCEEMQSCGRATYSRVFSRFNPTDKCHAYYAYFVTIREMAPDSLYADARLMNKINKDPFLHFVLKYTGSFDSLRLIPSSLAADRIEAFLNLDEDTQCKVVLFRNSAFLRMRVFYIDWYRVLVPYSSRSRSVPESKCDSAWSILTSPVAKKFYNVCSMYTDTARYGSTGQSCQWLSRFPAILDSLREVRGR